jgi:formamidopyrimidine-DNA glycosylase
MTRLIVAAREGFALSARVGIISLSPSRLRVLIIMPELPEVETVVRDLRPLLVGRTIHGVRKSRLKLRRPWRSKWNSVVVDLRVEGIRRRGKWILVDLAGAPVLRIHLGMTGQFTVVPASESVPDHLHLVFVLDNETELRFRDPRRFGSAEWFADRAVVGTAMERELGPEPFGLDAEYFRGTVRASSRNLKAILLDQTVVAGIGNIYADEACFRARLHPGRTGRSLHTLECDRLREALESVLTEAIESRGSSIRDYIGGSGIRGDYQNEFAVYSRTGEPCPECDTAISCVRLAGRSSHYCPKCQRIPPRRTQEPRNKPSGKPNGKRL